MSEYGGTHESLKGLICGVYVRSFAGFAVICPLPPGHGGKHSDGLGKKRKEAGR